MEETNVFKEWQKENEKSFETVEQNVRKNVQERRGFWAFVGGIIELYVPKVLDTLLGGATKSSDKVLKSGED